MAREVYLKHPDLAADRRWSGIDKDSKCAAVEELKRACERSVEVLQNGRVGDWFYDWLLKRVKKAKIANLAAAEKKNQR